MNPFVRFCFEVRHCVRGRGRNLGNVLAGHSQPLSSKEYVFPDLYEGRERLEKGEGLDHRAQWRLRQEVRAIGRPPEHGRGHRYGKVPAHGHAQEGCVVAKSTTLTAGSALSRQNCPGPVR
jgi:hypothetical protein